MGILDKFAERDEPKEAQRIPKATRRASDLDESVLKMLPDEFKQELDEEPIEPMKITASMFTGVDSGDEDDDFVKEEIEHRGKRNARPH